MVLTLPGIHSDILSAILSDIHIDILSDISFDILSNISRDILSEIHSGILSDILSDIHSDTLSDISLDILSDVSFVDKALPMSEKALREAKNTFYRATAILTIREHMTHQAEAHPYPTRRPNILSDQSAEWQDDEVRRYASLARSMLSMGCWNIPEENEERTLSSKDNFAFMLLNLGGLEREPRLPGKQSVPSHLIQNGSCAMLPDWPSKIFLM